MESKVCTKCNINKELSNFCKSKNNKDRLNYWCRECSSLSKGQKIYLGRKGTFKLKSHEFQDGTKLCSYCNEKKTIDNFGKSKKGNDAYCKKCRSIIYKYTTYNISPEDYNRILLNQNFKCKICKENNINNKPLYIDHCHKTNIVRGLLCNNCNTGLGMFKDNTELLLDAINYLQNFKPIIDLNKLEEQR